MQACQSAGREQQPRKTQKKYMRSKKRRNQKRRCKRAKCWESCETQCFSKVLWPLRVERQAHQNGLCDFADQNLHHVAARERSGSVAGAWISKSSGRSRTSRMMMFEVSVLNLWKGCKFDVLHMWIFSNHFAWQLQETFVSAELFRFRCITLGASTRKRNGLEFRCQVSFDMLFLKEVSRKSCVCELVSESVS